MKELIIKNFQAHKDTTITLAKTMTAITGQSHHGKSSVIRAVGWMRDNKPKNPRFIRKGTKKATVTIGTVRHERTEKTNKYFIEGKKDPFTALRGAVPEEVKEALGLGPDNIQGQHDRIFLLDDSPGKVAAKLSTLVDLESTTTALKYIAQKKRTHKANAESLKKLIEETEAQIEKLSHVDTADADLTEIESEGSHIERLRAKWYTLDSTIKKAVQANLELSDIPDTSALEPARKLEKAWVALEELKSDRQVLYRTIYRIEQLQGEVQFDPSKLLKRANRLLKMQDKRLGLSIAVGNAGSFELEVAELKDEEAALQARKDELLKGECPLCGRA